MCQLYWRVLPASISITIGMPFSSIRKCTTLSNTGASYPVLWLVFNLKRSRRRLAKAKLRLVKFNFEVTHQPIIDHQAADAMARFSKTKTK